MTTTTTRELCRACEATPAGCTTLQTLGGRRCCMACTHHDKETDQ